jgi:hypothetical protein
MMNARTCNWWMAFMVALVFPANSCRAGLDFNLSVGYADSERTGYVAPNPWQGSPEVVFEGNQGVFWDSGGLRIDNTGTSVLNFGGASVFTYFDANDTSVSGYWNLWSPTSIAPGQTLILAQTFATNADNTNFDTSDAPLGFDMSRSTNTNPLAYGMAYAPLIQLEIDNMTFSFYDQDHILIDKGLGNPTGASHNESRPWEYVGTGTATMVPEPASALSLGLGIAALLAVVHSRPRRDPKG